MNVIPPALRQLVPAAALLILATPLPANSAVAQKGRLHATPPKSASASGAIIPLPLNPVVPASQRLCTARTASGLGYTVLRPATGAKPAGGDVTLVNYIGYLAASGTVFDQGMHSALPIDGVIAGFAEGLKMMTKAEIVRFCIPAAMGYGAQGSGPIPANSDLVFQVELLDYKTAAEVETMRSAQSAEPAEKQ